MKYKVIERANPRDRSKTKFYVQPIRNETLKRKNIEKYIIDTTALSKAEARGVTITIVDYINDELLKGNAVCIEGLGTFSIRVQSEGSDKAEDVTAANVKNVVINFRSDKYLRENVSKIQFEKTSE